jgi:hypothetical protein
LLQLAWFADVCEGIVSLRENVSKGSDGYQLSSHLALPPAITFGCLQSSISCSPGLLGNMHGRWSGVGAVTVMVPQGMVSND